jgi:HK97 family phage major capsid protein
MNHIKDKKLWWAVNFGTQHIKAPDYISMPGLGFGMIGVMVLLTAALMLATSVVATAATVTAATVKIGGVGYAATLLVQKRNELTDKTKALHKVFEEAGPDRDFTKVKCLGEGQTTVAIVEKVKAMNKELDSLGVEIEGLAEADQIAEGLKARGVSGIDQPETPNEEQRDRGGIVKTLGQLFVESKAFKTFQKGSAQGPVDTVQAELKTLMSTSAGWGPETLRNGMMTGYPTRPAPRVVEFIPQQPTNQSAIVYMEETTFTNNATETTEGSTYGEGALALTERSVTVRKISTFLPVTDEQLEDVAGIQAYVENRLGLMVRQRLDSQCLSGTGVMPSGLVGTEQVSGIQTQALSTDSIPDAIYKLFTLIRSDGFAEPGVVFINPSKWQSVALLKTADGLYIWGHPSESGPERIWGVPVVQTTAGTSTKAVAGDYATHAFLAIKRGLEFQISSSHSTYFVEGKQAIRADMRAAMVHLRPKAFGVVTGL